MGLLHSHIVTLLSCQLVLSVPGVVPEGLLNSTEGIVVLSELKVAFGVSSCRFGTGNVQKMQLYAWRHAHDVPAPKDSSCREWEARGIGVDPVH